MNFIARTQDMFFCGLAIDAETILRVIVSDDKLVSFLRDDGVNPRYRSIGENHFTLFATTDSDDVVNQKDRVGFADA